MHRMADADDDSRVDSLEHRLTNMEQRVAAGRSEPPPGSREDLIRRGFALTDDSRVRARATLAAAKARRAGTDWAAVREQLGLPREGRPARIPVEARIAKLELRLRRLESRMSGDDSLPAAPPPLP